MIWAVPLSTVDLITHRLTPGHKSLAFGVYLNSVTHDGPLVQTVLYLQDSRFRGSPLKRFRREPAIPSSFGISPLPTPHPSLFQQTRVRASSAFYRTFTLDMGRSPGFGYITTYFVRPFQTRFRCGSGFSTLTLHVIMTRRFILQEARRHPLTGSDSL